MPEGHKAATDDDIAKINEFMSGFKETGKLLQSECKEQASKMMRAFCVLVLSANMNSETKEWTSKFENYRVLVGQ